MSEFSYPFLSMSSFQLSFFVYPGVDVCEKKHTEGKDTLTPTPTVHSVDLWQSKRPFHNRGEDTKLNSISLLLHLIVKNTCCCTGSASS